MTAETATTFDLSDFHGVGKPISGALSISDALKQAGLDFTVSQHNLVVYDKSASVEIKDNQNMIISKPSVYNGLQFPYLSPIVRDDTLQVISIMGSGYKLVQNIECVEAMAEILAEADREGKPISLFRGGIAKNCDLLFLAGRLPVDMEIENQDGTVICIHQYLVIQWSHTGAGKVSLSFVSYSPAKGCFLYPGSSQFEMSVRHTKNAATKMDVATKYLQSCYRAFTSFGRELQELANKPMDQTAFETFLEHTLFPYPDDIDENTQGGKRTKSIIDNKKTAIRDRYKENNGKTAFDLYVAVCEHQDKDATVKQKKEGKEDKDICPESELRLFSSFKGTGAKAKADALSALNSW